MQETTGPPVGGKRFFDGRWLGEYATATLDHLAARGCVLANDVADLLTHASEHYD